MLVYACCHCSPIPIFNHFELRTLQYDATGVEVIKSSCEPAKPPFNTLFKFTKVLIEVIEVLTKTVGVPIDGVEALIKVANSATKAVRVSINSVKTPHDSANI